MPRLQVDHETIYRYDRTVSFGPHRLMFRPRDSHDMRVLDTALEIEPAAQVRWMHDVFSNSIAIAAFDDGAQTLRFLSRIVVEHYGLANPDFPVDPSAELFPFSYPHEVIPDLARTVERHYPDPARKIDAWAHQFIEPGIETETLLRRINSAIKEQFRYEPRHAIGTQSPLETLENRAGTCRDFALFMMEASRALGLAARFVSGYLYDPALDPAADGSALPALAEVQGSGATHAWVQIFLPGAGWVEYDPTNGRVGGANLIRVAVARDPSQAIPLQGVYFGDAAAFQDMEVTVSVTALT